MSLENFIKIADLVIKLSSFVWTVWQAAKKKATPRAREK